MIKVVFKNLLATEIPKIKNQQSLHIIDFRATGETLSYDIDAMWRYENWVNALPIEGYMLVNDESEKNSLKNIIVRKADKSHESLAGRFLKQNNNFEFADIIAYVAHPDIDTLGEKLNIPVSFTYKDYLKFNNKITQKELLKNLTPNWRRVEKESLWADDYSVLKRADGSGGWGVFIKGVHTEESVKNAYKNFPDSEWYMESFIEGDPMSVQIYKDKENYTVFGFSEMIIENKRNFVGAHIKSIDNSIKLFPWMKTKIEEAILLLHPLLSNYSGFMGLDFIIQKDLQSISILETNVRMTSVSIAMLLCNEKNEEGILYEGYVKEIEQNDIVLARDINEADIVKFK
jgi:hypothetical protein